jgi:UDP-N-acetylmuramate dehydrogenase
MSSSDPKALEHIASRLDAAHLRRDEPLARYTTFKIGGPADLFFEATSADALANAVLAARENAVPYFVLGLGANVLIGDRGFRGLVIRNTASRHEFRERGDGCRLWTESGAVVKDLIQESVRRGWSGLEQTLIHISEPTRRSYIS